MNPLAVDLALNLDPAVIFRATGLGMPDLWQAEVLRAPLGNTLMLCNRQAGKSTIAAALTIKTALTIPGSLILLISPSQRQSIEIFKKVQWFYTALQKPVVADKENSLCLELSNRSRVVALPGHEATVRGYSGARLIVLDEAARIEEALYRALRPMLATSGGSMVCLSTPFGKFGWFYEAWENGEGWQRIKIRASDCPRIPASFLDSEKKALGQWYFQEYECEFLDFAGSVFPASLLENFIVNDIRPLNFSE